MTPGEVSALTRGQARQAEALERAAGALERIAAVLDRIEAGAAAAAVDEIEACAHPESSRADASVMGRERWSCRDCGYSVDRPFVTAEG